MDGLRQIWRQRSLQLTPNVWRTAGGGHGAVVVSIDPFRKALGIFVLPWWVVALLRGVLLPISCVGAQAT